MTRTSRRTAPDQDTFADAAEVFQLLSTPGRLHVLWLGSKNEADVGALVRAVGGTKAGISQHLAKLRLPGGTDGHRDGRRVLYPVADPHIVTPVHQGGEHILGQRAEPGTGRHRASRPVNVKDLKPTGTPS